MLMGAKTTQFLHPVLIASGWPVVTQIPFLRLCLLISIINFIHLHAAGTGKSAIHSCRVTCLKFVGFPASYIYSFTERIVEAT